MSKTGFKGPIHTQIAFSLNPLDGGDSVALGGAGVHNAIQTLRASVAQEKAHSAIVASVQTEANSTELASNTSTTSVERGKPSRTV